MNLSIGILVLLFVFGVSSSCNARQMVASRVLERNSVSYDTSDLQMNHEDQELEVEPKKIIISKSENVCTLCEQFTSDALIYLADNTTQTQIISALHQSCSQLRSFKTECGLLVDYYVGLLFIGLSTIQPGYFCQRVNLCQQITTTSSSPDSCDICHRAIDEIIVKLKDPDTQLEILEILLKFCDSADNYAKKCKRLVFEYAPVIITNGEKFLETTDICSTLRACNSSTTVNNQDWSLVVLADS